MIEPLKKINEYETTTDNVYNLYQSCWLAPMIDDCVRVVFMWEET